jgi:hypothetical protein
MKSAPTALARSGGRDTARICEEVIGDSGCAHTQHEFRTSFTGLIRGMDLTTLAPWLGVMGADVAGLVVETPVLTEVEAWACRGCRHGHECCDSENG